MSEERLHDLFSIRGRFYRSVQLERDWIEQRGLKDYLLTPTSRELSVQIMKGAKSLTGPKAWSITGPYGSGKSAFALFLTDILASEIPEHTEARAIRAEVEFGERPFVAVTIVGHRTSLKLEILNGLFRQLDEIEPDAAAQLRDHEDRRNGNRELSSVIEKAAKVIKKQGYQGLFIAIDEFGKFLEYAAQNPDSEDLLVLQDLAELAARNQVPIILVTILHSAFNEYLGPLDDTRRVEWQKVQGRFADIAFLEPPEQFLRLIGAAIEPTEEYEYQRTYYDEVLTNLVHSKVAEESERRISLERVLPDCVPLHPWTALILWPLFRSKLAQNERSLFAFLVDQGPFGFQDYLSVTNVDKESPSFYRLDQLYDYVVMTLGPAVLLGSRARRWAEISHAVDRVPANAPPLARSIVKAIGLLGLYGASVGLRASSEILQWAFNDKIGVNEAISLLEQASIIIYRRHERAFGLWEGSDVDLEEAYENAIQNVGEGRLASRLKRIVNLRPHVAKAHYIQSGTLRFFQVEIADGNLTNIKSAMEPSISNSDGRITFFLTNDPLTRQNLIEEAKLLATGEQPLLTQLQILAFPKPMIGLEQALLEVEAWTWISENTQELQGDPVARQEVKGRISVSQRQLQQVAGQVLSLRGYLFEPANSIWIQAGQEIEINSAIEFQRWLSLLCDEIFSGAPSLHNELINRNRISSAATSARRILIQSMLDCEAYPKLSINGTPAEYSIYQAMLVQGGFHRPSNGLWVFGKPESDWSQVWNKIEDFLETTTSVRRPYLELVEILKAPPFGLREGPIPILICTFLLARRKEVALYEEGLYVPELRIEVFERLTRVPESFELQMYRLTLDEKEAFASIADVLKSLKLSKSLSGEMDLLTVIRPLVVFAARLPDFSKRTKRIEPGTSIVLRDALLSARDPYKLIFQDLPNAFKMNSNGSDDISAFTETLRDSLNGLQRAYPSLLDDIENQIRDGFGLHGSSVEVRNQLSLRAMPLRGYTANRTLSLFVNDASRIDERDWREVLARVINRGIPPTHWNDHDVVDFQMRLLQIASDFTRLEELVAEKRANGTSSILRIGWLDGQLEEARAVITVPPESSLQIEELASKIEMMLEAEVDSKKNGHRLQLAIIARLAQRYLQDSEEGEHE